MNSPNLNGLFNGLSGGVGGVYMQETGARGPGLAGEADVMMISGMGADVGMSTPQGVPLAQPTLRGQLNQPITIGPFTFPLWGWLTIAALLGGAGGYYLGRR